MSADPEARLRDLSSRVERLALAPAELAERRPWLHIAKPFLRLFRWRPQIRTAALRSLLTHLRDAPAPRAAGTGSAPDARSSPSAAKSAESASTEQGRAAIREAKPGAREGADQGRTSQASTKPAVIGSSAEQARAAVAAAKALAKAREAALDELEDNIAMAERAAVVDGAGAHGPLAGWLTRLHEVTARAARAAAAPEDETKRASALELDGEWALTPLSVRTAAPGDAPRTEDDSAPGDDPAASRDRREKSRDRNKKRAAAGTSQGGAAAPDDAAGPADSGDAAWENDPRLVEIELAAIDRVLDAARAETHFLGRRRRLFEAARKLLLDASAALPLDPAAVNGRAQHIADQIVLANRWEAAGVGPDVALPYQAVTALARGERQRLYATLRASFSVACCDGDVALASRARDAIRKLEIGAGEASPDASTAQSASELLGDVTIGAVRDAYEAARRELAFKKLAPPAPDEDAAEIAKREILWGSYLHDDAMLATLSAAVSVDGCFEVGGTLAPVRVQEETQRIRFVTYPTQDLVLVPTSDAADLPNAMIEDPRGVLLALAEGRLLARKFRKVDTVRTSRTRLTSEARIYVLDGSDSMLVGTGGRTVGARARMRDAILLAELATLYRRATEGSRDTRVVLFYRYFTKYLGDVARVATPSEAVHAMAQVVATPRHGGTDIEAALLASFDLIREARATDRDLARAQIVLVTDGEAAVDEPAIRAAREREGDFPIGVSVIALGEENPVLRRLVARQRARGEPAFYHFVSDVDLASIVAGRRAAGTSVHGASSSPEAAPSADPAPTPAENAALLAAELGTLVDEIEALDRTRLAGRSAADDPSDAMGTADADALAATGLPRTESEGDRARRESWERDERALAARFDVWFPACPPPAALRASAPPKSPAPPAKGGAAPSLADAPLEAESEADPADMDASLVVLATLADVLADLGGTPAERRADAIDLLERLLPDARLSPARYRAVVRDPNPRVTRAIEAVRAAVAASPAAPSRAVR